jgi:hypothetical protein
MVIHTIYIQARLRSPEPRALQILVHSFIGQPGYLTSSLAAGGSHTVPVSSYIHIPSASANQAYRPPVRSFGIHFGKPFGKHFVCLEIISGLVWNCFGRHK